MNTRVRILISALLLIFSLSIATANDSSPKRVLILHSFGPDFGDLYSKDLRAALDRELPGQLELYEQWLVSARFPTPREDSAFVDYLRALFADHPLDLIITLGAPAANFLQTHHQSLFTNTPELLGDVEQRRVAPVSSQQPQEAVVAISLNVAAVIENILRVRPQTKHLFVVIGNSPNEKYWVGQFRDALQPFSDRFTSSFLNDLPFDELLKRAGSLPSASAIFYVLLSPTVSGIPADENAALAQLHAAANAPIFSYTDVYLGKGIVGGPLVSGEGHVKDMADVAVRILRGEAASTIKTPARSLGRPQYDWRELQRWHIDRSALPAGSVIRFVEKTVWEQYRWLIWAVILVVLLQSLLIFDLLHERRRRHAAETVSRQRLAELARVNRIATVGELSASIAHELGQPLGAILRNSEAAAVILDSETPDLAELREIVNDIQRDDHRAGDVIARLRRLLTKAPMEGQDVDLNDAVREVVGFLGSLATGYQIFLSTSLIQPSPQVRCDRVQLQQVILNTVINAIDAMAHMKGSPRTIVARTAVLDDRFAEVSIEDSGPGLPRGKEQEIFEPFFTTKEAGMGVGLSIARTIIENIGGKIVAANREPQGAVFRFTLPLSKPKHSHHFRTGT
jgi:signal transduction histidine kinase